MWQSREVVHGYVGLDEESVGSNETIDDSEEDIGKEVDSPKAPYKEPSEESETQIGIYYSDPVNLKLRGGVIPGRPQSSYVIDGPCGPSGEGCDVEAMGRAKSW